MTASDRSPGPFSRLEWMIAGRYLRARRREGTISIIAGFSLVGILLGVGTLIVVMSVMNGFRVELVDRILGAQPHIIALSSDRTGLTDYDALASRLARNPDVTRAAPMIEGQLMASSDASNSGALVRGMRKDDLLTLDGVANPEMAQGDIQNYEQGVAIGAGLADKLRLGVGDTITLISPRGMTTPFGVKPRIKSYPITYIFRIGMHQYDSAFVFMPLEEAQRFFNKPDRVDGIEMMVTDPDLVEEISESLYPALGTNVFLWNWQRENGAFITALKVEANVMFLVLSLIFLIVALNIVSGLIMLVKEKTPHIGIMRTFGMRRGAIMRIFFIAGSAIGVTGTILGVVGGVLFTVYIHDIQGIVEWVTGTPVWDSELRYLTRLPAVLQWGDVLLTVATALSFSFLATLYPAWRAARLDPVEALRNE
ncbi:lipoprotein-releasing ABC transporter permease subunit [Rhodobacteraceae bacterium NNCM2]|nr:lipoprotein-releasing ABC transporter permease subunit [Coraliihabitans acroporae]